MAEAQEFLFTAKAPGRVSLKFNYSSGAYEPCKPPLPLRALKTITFHIKIVKSRE